VNRELDHTSSLDVRFDAASCGFDFGKLWHSPVTLNEKACTRAGLVEPQERAEGTRAELFDFGFLVSNVFTYDWVVLLHVHLLGVKTLVLHRHIEVTGTGGGEQFHFFAHG
jgi:hypothetical protein